MISLESSKLIIGSSWLDDSIHTKEELLEEYGDRILIDDDTNDDDMEE